VPFAEFLNHENVNIGYDYLNKNGETLKKINDEDSEEEEDFGEEIISFTKKIGEKKSEEKIETPEQVDKKNLELLNQPIEDHYLIITTHKQKFYK